MPDSPNKLSNLWQELKRRNVTRVLAVYIAAAFMILELVDMISEPFGLPEGSLKLVFFILLVGLVIAVIVSWIYDIHPEGGLVKTEPAHQIKTEEIPKSSNSWKIASYISFVVIVALIVLNIIPRAKQSEEIRILEKSVAVLPFINDSPDQENEYFINGIMEDLLINLQSIKDLRVPGRTSAERYRNNQKSIPEIAKEMNVRYIVEGSGQRYGNKIRLRVQLVEGAGDKHIWAESYDEVISEPEDIFRIQSKIAKSIAAELQAVITPEVEQRIESVPTSNLEAYENYQRGREELWKNSSTIFKTDFQYLENAEVFYRMALSADSKYAQAYAGLAEVFLEKYLYFGNLLPANLDSVLFLADKALSLEDKLALAHSIKGRYYVISANDEQALKEFEIANELNPNDYQIYSNQGSLYSTFDCVKSLTNYHKAASLLSGKDLAQVLARLSGVYIAFGFEEKGSYYAREALRLGGDSAIYYSNIATIESNRGNLVKAITYLDKVHSIHPSDRSVSLRKGLFHGFNGNYQESIRCFEKFFEGVEVLGNNEVLHLSRLGFAYWQIGQKEKAKQYFDQRLNYFDGIVNQAGNPMFYEPANYYDLSGIFAFLGMREEALEHLRQFLNISQQLMPHWISWLNGLDPMFDNIRDEPEFQQIVKELESKYQAEHERVRQWLEENDLL